MGLLDDMLNEKPRFTPPKTRCYVPDDILKREVELNNHDRSVMSDDFSDQLTPQERSDKQIT